MQRLLARCQLIYTKQQRRTVEDALEYATLKHGAQKRVSGEPYITHPIAVANILLDLGMDYSSVCAALLHDVIEDTDATEEEIREKFGDQITELVLGVTKLKKITFKSKEQEQAENFRKMFFAMAKDIRVLIIKLADRLHNMRTVEALSRERQEALANETLEIYARLASRLGQLHEMRDGRYLPQSAASRSVRRSCARSIAQTRRAPGDSGSSVRRTARHDEGTRSYG